MSQNYNINMKKFNGTDYDGLLPLAYNALNSQQLDGKTFNEIQNLFRSEVCTMYRLERQPTNTYGENNPVTIVFPVPIMYLIFMGFDEHEGWGILSENIDSDNFNSFSHGSQRQLLIKKSTDNTSFTFYSGKNAQEQYNSSLYRSVFYGLSGKVYGDYYPIFNIVESGTWVVPESGKYYIELYGGGGGGYYESSQGYTWQSSGGSSCQSYSNIQLTKRQSITITIGKGRNKGAKGEDTKFGTYTCAGGGGGRQSYAGKGAGNLRTEGKYSTPSGGSGGRDKNYSKGLLAPKKYGWGRGCYDAAGGNGGVVLKYLGNN